MSPTTLRNPSPPSPSPSFDTQPPTRSRTSSTASIKHPLNPHPYAIKTTSSAVTSSSSPAHNQASYKHYVPPPSPSPTGEAPGWRARSGSFSSASGVYPVNGVVGGGGGSQGHRYTRSMTDAGPRALPIPPSMDRSASTSPTKSKSNFVEMEADAGYFGSRERGVVRMMRSLNGMNASGEVDAVGKGNKSDKGRTPRQSAVHAPSMRRAGTLPSEHSHSNSPFVFPVPHPPTTRAEPLLSSEDEDDHNTGDLDSNSHYYSSTNKERARRTTGSRVRGMVASFERSASSSSGSELDDDDGSPSTHYRYNNEGSPVKRTTAGMNRRSVADLFTSASPAQSPQGAYTPYEYEPASTHAPAPYAPRPPTSTLPDRAYAYPQGEGTGESDDPAHTTLKPTTFLPTPSTPGTKPKSKELPRLLPYPPPLAQSLYPASPTVGGTPPAAYGTPGGVVVPMHTGAGYPLPVSPEHTGGYHTPGGGGRLLPIPPDLVASPQPRVHEGEGEGQAEGMLHHPRPVRGGPPELVTVDLGVQSEGEEELSMEELLKREEADELGRRRVSANGHENANGSAVDSPSPSGGGSESGSVTKSHGVRAWESAELAIGETVKRVPGGPRGVSASSNTRGGRVPSVGKRTSPLGGSNADGDAHERGTLKQHAEAEAEAHSPTSPTIAYEELGKAGGLVSVRKGRRARVRPRGSRSSLEDSAGSGGGASKYCNASSQTDVAGQMYEHESTGGVAFESSGEVRARVLDIKEKEVEVKERGLEVKERGLEVKERELDGLSREIEDTQRELESVRVELEARGAEVEAWGEGVGVREALVGSKARAVDERFRVVEEKEREVEEREERVRARERELEVRAENLKMSLEERAREVEGREVEVMKREEELVGRLEEVKRREEEIKRREEEIKRREGDVGRRESEVPARARGVDESTGVSEREAKLDEREVEIGEREVVLKTMEEELRAREMELKKKEEAMAKRETTLDLAARVVRRVVGRVLGTPSSPSITTLAQTPSTSASASASIEDEGKVDEGSKVVSKRGLGRTAYPYMVVLGLGVCAVVVRVLVKGVGGAGGRSVALGGKK